MMKKISMIVVVVILVFGLANFCFARELKSKLSTPKKQSEESLKEEAEVAAQHWVNYATTKDGTTTYGIWCDRTNHPVIEVNKKGAEIFAKVTVKTDKKEETSFKIENISFELSKCTMTVLSKRVVDNKTKEVISREAIPITPNALYFAIQAGKVIMDLPLEKGTVLHNLCLNLIEEVKYKENKQRSEEEQKKRKVSDEYNTR